MATRAVRLNAIALTLVLTAWIWALVGVLYTLRWNSTERPLPPAREVFLYGELRVGVDASYPPFAVATADDLWGLEIDLARAIGAQLDIPVRFVNLGYDGLYDALRVDSVDVLISMLPPDAARQNDVLYTLPYFNAGLVLVSDDPALDAMEAMTARSLAYEFGSAGDAEARRWLRRVMPFETRPYELSNYALDAVRVGEADAALVDAISARLYLREHPDWDAHYTYVTDTWFVIAARTDRGAAWNAVNHTLQTMIDNGTLDALIDQWL